MKTCLLSANWHALLLNIYSQNSRLTIRERNTNQIVWYKHCAYTSQIVWYKHRAYTNQIGWYKHRAYTNQIGWYKHRAYTNQIEWL